jgi:hypothetical protein
VAQAFFGDESRLQRDVLRDAAARLLGVTDLMDLSRGVLRQEGLASARSLLVVVSGHDGIGGDDESVDHVAHRRTVACSLRH